MRRAIRVVPGGVPSPARRQPPLAAGMSAFAWSAGAKGRKSRRVPITPKLAAAIKRYEVRLIASNPALEWSQARA